MRKVYKTFNAKRNHCNCIRSHIDYLYSRYGYVFLTPREKADLFYVNKRLKNRNIKRQSICIDRHKKIKELRILTINSITNMSFYGFNNKQHYAHWLKQNEYQYKLLSKPKNIKKIEPYDVLLRKFNYVRNELMKKGEIKDTRRRTLKRIDWKNKIAKMEAEKK